MLQNPNLDRFATSLVAKNLISANSHTYRNAFLRLFWIRRLTEFFFTGLLIYAGTKFFFINQYAPIWAFSGVALSALYMRGNVVLIAIFMSLFISFFSASFNWMMSLWQSVLFTAVMFLIRYTGMRLVGAIIPLAHFKVYTQWLLIVCFFVIVHIALMLHQAPLIDQYAAWLSEMNGILCLTPLCMIFTPFTPLHYFNLQKWPWILAGLLVLVLHLLYFVLPINWLIYYAAGMMVLLITYSRFGLFPLCLILLILSVLYIASIEGRSLFQATTAMQTIVLETLFFLSVILSLGFGIYWHNKTTRA